MIEHEHEPVPGLPEELPLGEQMLWQGTPTWKALALRRFHARKVAIYFGAVLLWQEVAYALSGASLAEMTSTALWISLPGMLAVAILCGLAWFTSRTSLYTITSRRVVMRVGIALPMTINIPFSSIDAVGLRQSGEGVGDVRLSLGQGERCSYLVAWPHIYSGLLSRPQPMLLSVPACERVARILANALGQPVESTVETHIVRSPAPGSRVSEPATADLGTPVRAMA